jgi:hypothetical protein
MKPGEGKVPPVMAIHSTATYEEDCAASAELIKDIGDVPETFVLGSKMLGVTDAQETMVFARQLETIKRRVYETKYPELKGRRFVPESREGGEASESLVYRVWDDYLMAKVVGNYSTDIPLVTSSAREYRINYYTVATGYMYSVDDLRQAQKAGTGLKDRLAQNVRRSIELLRDEHTAFGTPETGSFGLVNHPNVGIVSLPFGDWSNVARTGEQILADLNFVITSMMNATNEIFMGDTLLMSIAAYRLIATKLLNTGNASNITVLQAFQAQNPGISIESWTKLALANAAGNNGRMVFYKKDPEVLEFEVGVDFEQFGPEVRAMTYTTVCRARWAGVQIQYPSAVSYIDGQLI